MALKTVQLSPNLARPAAGSYGFSRPSSPPSYYRPIKLPPRPAAAGSRIFSTNKQQQHQKSSSGTSSSSVLRCAAANLHGGGCRMDDEVVRSKRNDGHEAAAETTIPVVLCPSVAFPGATLQLQAFEFRYRIMMQTLLLHRRQEEAAGLLKFGVVYAGRNGRAMADVGCVVQVVRCERLIDDRFFLTCVAGDRFRVTEIVRTKPYVVARIQVLDNHDRLCSSSDSDSESDTPQHHDDVGSLLVQQVQHHLKSVAMLSQKLNLDLRGDHQHQAVRRPHSAASFSFLVARLFVEDPSEKQALLQTDDTAHRLAREGVYLERRSKYLAAVAAIKDAFHHLSCNEK